jgi:ubiquinone/menaquinone biosynthesis C-methylase UbiE
VTTVDQSQLHWEIHYRDGALASCALTPEVDLDAELQAGWDTFFGAVRPGGRVLDLATGNGIIAAIAADVSRARGLGLEIHGVDRAAIQPLRDVRRGRERLEGVQFHPRVAAESLPFPDAHFAAAAGLFALEYTEVPKALRELARVLEPGAPARFVLHHRDSALVANAGAGLHDARFVVKELAFPDWARKLIVEQARFGDTPASRRALEELNKARRRVTGRLQQRPNASLLVAVLSMVDKAMQMRGKAAPQAILQAMDANFATLNAYVRRMNDVWRVALSADQAATLAAIAREAGFGSADLSVEAHDGGRVFGWLLELRRT